MKEPFKMEDVQDETYIDRTSPWGYRAVFAGLIALFIVVLVFSVAHLMVGGGHPTNHQGNGNGKENGKENGKDKVQESDIVVLTAENFEETTRSGVVLVDFWMHGCRPCEMMQPAMEKIATEMKGKAVVAKINGPENARIAQQFGIEAYPTVVLFHNGKQVDFEIGLQSESHLRGMIKAAIEWNQQGFPEPASTN